MKTMTAPPELIGALDGTGATLVVEAGTERGQGAKVPDGLLAALNGQRAVAISEWQRTPGAGA